MFGTVSLRRVVSPIVGFCVALTLAGCASTTGDVTSLKQPQINEPESFPWDGQLTKADDGWSLRYVEKGNLTYGKVKNDAIRGRVPAEVRGDYAWYPNDPALEESLPPSIQMRFGAWQHLAFFGLLLPLELIPAEGPPTWGTYAAVIEQIKKQQAGSVSEYDRRLAKVVNTYHEVQQKKSKAAKPTSVEDYRDQALQIIGDRKRQLEAELEDRIEVRIEDRTPGRILRHISREPDGEFVRVSASFQGQMPTFVDETQAPQKSQSWVPAEDLEALEAKAEAAQNRLEQREQYLAGRKQENEKRLSSFRQGLSAEDFVVTIGAQSMSDMPYDGDIRTPEVRQENGQFAVSGPAVVQIKQVQLDPFFDPVGIEPSETPVRKNPSADSAVVRQVSGTRVGYELVSGRNDEWSLLYGEDSELIGWVRSEAVVSPDRARKAALKRTLDDTRPDGSPTDEALKTLVLLDLAESNRRSPDLGGLVGDMELRSFEVIACDDAVNEAGYNCDVRGRLDTNNMGVQAMQGMLSRLGGNTGRSGVVPYRAQLRVAQNRDGLWRIVESRGLQ